jgi:hypothetical protein
VKKKLSADKFPIFNHFMTLNGLFGQTVTHSPLSGNETLIDYYYCAVMRLTSSIFMAVGKNG